MIVSSPEDIQTCFLYGLIRSFWTTGDRNRESIRITKDEHWWEFSSPNMHFIRGIFFMEWLNPRYPFCYGWSHFLHFCIYLGHQKSQWVKSVTDLLLWILSYISRGLWFDFYRYLHSFTTQLLKSPWYITT